MMIIMFEFLKLNLFSNPKRQPFQIERVSHVTNNLLPLTKEEERKPYSKLYYRDLPLPNPKLSAILDKGPINPSKALTPWQINNLLDPGYDEVETGYCVCEDGTAYVAVNNAFPNCTIEMFEWFYAWKPLENLRYKIWCPGEHEGIHVRDEDVLKIKDMGIPIEEKTRDVVHYCKENVGGGVMTIVIHYMRPEAVGYDLGKLKGSPVKFLVCGYGVMENGATSMMTHTMREVENGVEFRTRFWLGYALKDGKPVKTLPDGMKISETVAKGLAYHNVVEYTNLAQILPDLYKEYGGTF